jgi:hypothetical protein
MKFYIICSIVVAILDLYKMYKQENFLQETPIGDLEEYVEPKKIVGVHNFVFLPSLLIIMSYLLVVHIINEKLCF